MPRLAPCRPASWCWPRTPPWCSTGKATASRATPPGRRACCALADADVDWYVHTREWRERAGGYAIQARGAALVESIDGDYTNVVGLPVPALLRLAPYLLQP